MEKKLIVVKSRLLRFNVSFLHSFRMLYIKPYKTIYLLKALIKSKNFLSPHRIKIKLKSKTKISSKYFYENCYFISFFSLFYLIAGIIYIYLYLNRK